MHQMPALYGFLRASGSGGKYELLQRKSGARIPGKDAICDERWKEKKVAVIGGDVGCEITIQLQTMGKTVDVIEAEDALMKHPGDFWENRIFTEYFMTHEYKPDLRNFDDLQKVERVSVHLNATCTEITEQGVAYVDSEGKPQFIEADTVILSTGLKNGKGAATLDHLAQTVVYAGDRKEVSNIENATRTAYAASLQI